MFCRNCEFNTGFGSPNFKLEYKGLSIDGVNYGTRIQYAGPSDIIVPAAQKIAEHVWKTIYAQGEKDVSVYINLTAIIHPNGTVFVKLRIYVHNVSQSFARKKTIASVNMYAPAGNFLKTIELEIGGTSCIIPEQYNGKAPVVGVTQIPIN